MISVTAFFSGTLNTVDAVIGDFVNQSYMHFVRANAGVITLLLTVYIMFLGYQFVTHSQPLNLSVITKRLIIILCVYGMVMNWRLYHLFVYHIFTAEPENIAHLLIQSTSKSSSIISVTQALDDIYNAVIHAAWGLFGQVSFSGSGIAFLFYGMLVFIIGNLLCVFALLLFIYAKMMMAVSLALGPIFILFFLWESTKGLFSAWLNKLITIALIPIVTSIILMLMLSVINVTLPTINQPVDHMQFYGLAPFLGLSLTTTLILSQVFRICSALGNGITLVSISQGISIARASLQRSGIAPASVAAANWSHHKVKQVKQRLLRGKNNDNPLRWC